MYPGNWSPYVPRNLILRYTKPGEWVLDQFLGSGTTLIEAKLLGRHAIGVDINAKSLEISNANLKFQCNSNSKIFTKLGDARNLSFLKSESIDLICTHPPYADIIAYSKNIEGDLSRQEYHMFLESMGEVAGEAYRLLKSGKFCTLMLGDIRKQGNIVPLGMEVLNLFIKMGFNLKENIIKKQYNCRSSRYWKNKEKNFLMLAHEYIFVLKK